MSPLHIAENVRRKSCSIYGYKKLLKKAGFAHTRFFSLIPNDNKIKEIEDLGHMTFKYPGSLNLKKIVKKSKIIRKYMAHNLGLFSIKNGDYDNTIDSIIADITASLNNGRWEISDSTFQITQKGTFVFKLINRHRKQGINRKNSFEFCGKKTVESKFSANILSS